MFYQQVKLRKGDKEQISWVPSEYAKKGKVLKLKEGNSWEYGWEVSWVYRDIIKTHVEIIIDSEQHKHHRTVTDR